MSDDGHRKNCWCAPNRKPCAYHEGFQDAQDKNDEQLRAALKVVHSLTRPGVADRFLRDVIADLHEHTCVVLEIKPLS